MSLISTIEHLREFDTALLANTIGAIDSTPAEAIYMGNMVRSLTPELGPSVGIAVTCEMDTSSPENQFDLEAYWEQLEQIEAMSEPVIWVVKAVGSRPSHECILGDGMAKILTSVGCHAIVTNGGVRDVPGLLTANFAAYGSGVTIHHTLLRMASVNQPIEVGGITVTPGNILHANAEGVIRIPESCCEALPEAAARMRVFEHKVHGQFRRSDLSVRQKRQVVVEMREKYGFAEKAKTR